MSVTAPVIIAAAIGLVTLGMVLVEYGAVLVVPVVWMWRMWRQK